MKFTVSKSAFVNKLTPAMGTVSNKGTITAIEGVLIETIDGQIRISTFFSQCASSINTPRISGNHIEGILCGQFCPIFNKIIFRNRLMILRQVITMSNNKFIHHLFNGVDIQFTAGVRIQHSCLIDML